MSGTDLAKEKAAGGVGVYRYGEAAAGPALRVGVARHPPRGVRREELAARGYYDVWMPLLAPSRGLVAAYRAGELGTAVFVRRYRAEMRAPAARQCIRLLGAVSRRQGIALGCFCEDEARCHRRVLRELVAEAAGTAGAAVWPAEARAEFASPACSMPEIED